VYRPRHVDIPVARPNWIETVFFLLLILLIAFILLKSPLFEIRYLEVKGNNRVSKEEILGLSGINLGDNIFKTDFKKSCAEIKKLPLIKDVNIKRFLPARVVIEIEERYPVGVLATENGFIVVDAEGVYLLETHNNLQLPIITGVNAKLPAPGCQIDAGGLDTALAVITQLTPEVLQRLSEVHVEEEDKQYIVYIYTNDGIQGRLGRPSDVAYKSKLFIQVIEKLGSKKAREIKYIDLSYAGWPVILFKEGVKNNGEK